MMRLVQATQRFLIKNDLIYGSFSSIGTPILADGSNSFMKQVYGIQLEKHLLPHSKIRFHWTDLEIKYYQKKLPNYVVILVNRILAEKLHHDLPLSEKYYSTCIYAKIHYQKSKKNQVQIEGLYRAKIENIQEIEENEQNTDKTNSIEIQNQVEEQDGEQFIILDQERQGSRLQQLKSSSKRNNRKLMKLYFLTIKKVEEVPIVLNYKLEIRFKYLIEIYKQFFPSWKDKFYLFNTSQIYDFINQMANHMSNENQKQKEIQEYVEANEIQDKMQILQKLISKTLDWKEIFHNFDTQAQNVLRNKKFYQYYSEIFKIAKTQLDGKKGKEAFLERVTKDFLEKLPSDQVKEVFQQEKQKYAQMEQNSMESGVIKKYLEDLSKIPYNIKSEEFFDLQFAEKALQEEHYGMKQVKEAILQIIAVGKMKGTLKGKIFCLIGGPGLGKTTIAKSVAKALGRKFYNISLGGVSDSSVLKGHRRTYVAAYSGKIIEALKSCETNNPIILLDQIDKMGNSNQGDPRSELLQILDPNQNNSFVDNFIDVPVDLSNVLFICSANYQKNISKPLLDRLQKIKLNSYTDEEKKEILNRHILRRSIEKTGVKNEQFIFEEGVINSLIHQYSFYQPGVRYLQRNIDKILQKIAYKICQGVETLPIHVKNQSLSEYLGNSYHRLKDHNSIGKGVAISLSGGDWGSRLTYIEAFKKSFVPAKQHKRGLLFTGSLGDVFKEAMNISYTYARNFLKKQLQNQFLYTNQVHIHAPDGSSKKDGSTDSLTISAALVSLAISKTVKKGIAMTGELTLHGKILRTTGIKQKVLIAKREKIYEVIVPEENHADVQMLSQKVKEGITFHFVKQFKEVYELLFVVEKAKLVV